jgi:hypothetical protein
MLYFGTMLIMLVMLLVATIIGLRICDLFPFRLRPVSRYYFSPLLGLSALILIFTFYGWLAPFKTETSIGLVIPLVIASFFFERKKQTLPRYFLTIFVFAALAAIPVLSPLLRFDAYNPFNDTFTYLVHGQWLQTHPFSEPAVASGYYPALSQVALYQSAGHRMGASFMLAWAQAAFGLEWSYYAYPAVVSLPLVAGALAVGGGVKLIIRRQRSIAMLSACATAIMLNGFAFGALYGFFPQTFGLAFAAGGITLLGGLLTENLRQFDLKKTILHSIPVALLFAALTFSYNDILPFIVIAIIGCLFSLLLFLRGLDRKKIVLITALVLVAETAVLVNLEFVRIIRNLLSAIGVTTGAHAIGWPVLWSPHEFLAHAFGFRSTIGDIWIFYYPSISLPIFITVLALLLYFLYQFLKKRSSVYLYLNMAAVLVFIAGFLYFRYFIAAPSPAETGHTFLQFKLAKWASPFCFVLLGAAFAYFSRGSRIASRAVHSFLILIILLGLVANLKLSSHSTNHFLDETGYRHSAFSSLVHLREIVKRLNSDQVIYLNLGAEYHKLRQMIAYILYDRKLASDYSDDGYILGKIPPGERNIPISSATWVIEKSRPSDIKSMSSPVVGNLVLRCSSQVRPRLISIAGGYARETDDNGWWNWTPGTLSYKFHVLGEPETIRLKFTYLPATEGNVTILVKSEKETKLTLRMTGGWHEYISPPIQVDGSDVSITFKSDEKPVRISDNDPRLMSYLVKDIELIASSEYGSRHDETCNSINLLSSHSADLLSVSGGFPRESEGKNWWYWTDKQIIFGYKIPDGMRKIRLSFDYLPATEGRNVRVAIISGQKDKMTLKMKNGWNHFVSRPIHVSGSDLSIRFISDEPPVRISDNDSRLLSFLIKNIEIQKVRAR